ncbi:MAG: YHS domain-containing protein [Nitrososphaerales archaeon]
MAKDPVCGMQVDESSSQFKSNFGGRPYYFCSASCKGKFDKAPEKFTR